jgi:hypothetical protein
MKALQVRLTDESGKIYRWTIRRVPRAFNCMIGYSRVISGWEYVDHDGYVRFSEGNWLDLLPHVRATAENYGLKLLSELS